MLRRCVCKCASKTRRVEVCVIGGGPGGVAAALHARELDRTTCLIERARIGGADFWEGALQSKTMWELAKFAHETRNGAAMRAVRLLHPLPPVTHDNIRAALERAAATRAEQQLARLAANDVAVLQGTASFVTPNSIEVRSDGGADDGDVEVVESDYFVIAAGAQPRAHAMARADGVVVHTSDDIMHMPLPRSIVIIGAGVIGCEFASIYANFGQTRVSVIEKSDRILPMEDADVAMFVQQLLERKGVRFHHRTTLVDCKVVDAPPREQDASSNSSGDDEVASADSNNNSSEATACGGKRFQYTLQNVHDAALHTHVVDKALVSIGRVPNIAALRLDRIGVRVGDGGKLPRDKYMRVTPHAHIYACGDVAASVALVNVAEAEARACVAHAYTCASDAQLAVHLDNLSTIMFLDQEVAAVGVNEQQCQRANVAYRVATFGYEYVARALAMGNTSGFVKMIVSDDVAMHMLGVRAVGPHASSIIELASLAVHSGESLHNLRNLRTAYPGYTEAFQECVQLLLGSSTLKPTASPLLSVRSWSPPGFARGRAYQASELAKAQKDK